MLQLDPTQEIIISLLEKYGLILTIAKIDNEISDALLPEKTPGKKRDTSKLEHLCSIPDNKPLLKKLALIIGVMSSPDNRDILTDENISVISLTMKDILLECGINKCPNGACIITNNWDIYLMSPNYCQTIKGDDSPKVH